MYSFTALFIFHFMQHLSRTRFGILSSDFPYGAYLNPNTLSAEEIGNKQAPSPWDWIQWRRAFSLQWRHNGHDNVSNHQPHDCLLNRLFRCRSKKTSKLRITGFCAGNSPGPVNSPHKWPVTRKVFPFDNVIMLVEEINTCNIDVILQKEHSFNALTVDFRPWCIKPHLYHKFMHLKESKWLQNQATRQPYLYHMPCTNWCVHNVDDTTHS